MRSYHNVAITTSSQSTTYHNVLAIDNAHDHYELERVDEEVTLILTSRGTFKVKVVLAVGDARLLGQALVAASQ